MSPDMLYYLLRYITFAGYHERISKEMVTEKNRKSSTYTTAKKITKSSRYLPQRKR